MAAQTFRNANNRRANASPKKALGAMDIYESWMEPRGAQNFDVGAASNH